MDFKNKLKNKKKVILRVASIIVSLMVTIVLPLIIYLQALDLSLHSDINIYSYIIRLEGVTSQIIFIGILITTLLIVKNLFLPSSIYRLGVTLLVECLYIIYIIIASRAEIFETSTEFTYLRIDLSVLNLFLLPVSSIYIIRTILKYIFERRDLVCSLLILEAVHTKNINSKTKIRKYIHKDNGAINQNIKSYLIKNFSEIIKRLEYSPLVSRKSSNYIVTKSGIDLLKRHGKINFNKLPSLGPSSEPSVDTLQVWTEEDLEELAEKRERIKHNKKKYNE